MSYPSPVGSAGQRLYESLAPIAHRDEDTGWHLLIYCAALGAMRQELSDLVADTDDGPSWSPLLDVERCPADLLPFLAKFVGVRLVEGEDEDSARDRVRTPAGFLRGTPAALVAAAQRTLTGTKTVVLLERDEGDAYALIVITRTGETPDADATNRDLRAAKPVGLLLTHVVAPAQLWNEAELAWDDADPALTWDNVVYESV